MDTKWTLTVLLLVATCVNARPSLEDALRQRYVRDTSQGGNTPSVVMGYHIAASAPAFHPGNFWRLPPLNQPLVAQYSMARQQDEHLEQARRYNPRGPDTMARPQDDHVGQAMRYDPQETDADVELLRITPKQNGHPLKYVDADSVYLRNNRNVASGRAPAQLVGTDAGIMARPKARYVNAFQTNTQLNQDTQSPQLVNTDAGVVARTTARHVSAFPTNRQLIEDTRPEQLVDTDAGVVTRPKARYVSAFRTNTQLIQDTQPAQLVNTDAGVVARTAARHVSAFPTNTQLIEDTRRRIVSELNTRRTLLVLKPVARAVAGAGGQARATPVSHAIVRKGDAVDIHFDPQAVAVVGPGGSATAYSDLVISYTA